MTFQVKGEGEYTIISKDNTVKVSLYLPEEVNLGNSTKHSIWLEDIFSDVIFSCNQLNWEGIHSNEGVKVSNVNLNEVVLEGKCLEFLFDLTQVNIDDRPIVNIKLRDNVNKVFLFDVILKFRLVEAPSVSVDVESYYGLDLIPNVTVNLLDKDEEITCISNIEENTGNCKIILTNYEFFNNDFLTLSESEVEELIQRYYNSLFKTYNIEVDCTDYDSELNEYTVTSKNNELVIYLTKIDECQNVILTKKDCKYFLHEPYMTPNNFDLYFDESKIPENIIKESSASLFKRLQKTMPLTDILHLNLKSEEANNNHTLNFHTKLKLKFLTFDTSIFESRIKVKGVWKESEESTLSSNVTYEVYYLAGDNTPVSNAKVRLINLYFPLIQYVKTTTSNGSCVFEDLPYGTYVQQITLDEYNIPPTVIEINEEELNNKILVGSIDESDNIHVNMYTNGKLISNIVLYNNGDLEIDSSNATYESGVLDMGDVDEEEEEAIILLNDSDFEDISDFTEFTVDIKNDEGEVVDTVILNFMNNYTAVSNSLHLYEGERRINYTLDTLQENCILELEYLDLTKYNQNEVVLL